MAAAEQCPFVSRGGWKLAAALDALPIDPAGRVCADFGCNVGGFTDCLLQRGATRVYAVDTGYGELAWRLRKDDRVVVMERTNALRAEVPEPVDLVVLDLARTPLHHGVPAAGRWLKAGGQVVALLKPHYERAARDRQPPRKLLTETEIRDTALQVQQDLAELGWTTRAGLFSPIRGKGGNAELLVWLAPVAEAEPADDEETTNGTTQDE